MNHDKLTISSVRQYLVNSLSPYYPEGELNAIIIIILSFISGKNRTFVLGHPHYEIPSYNWFKVKKICSDLKNMMPVQYVTGETEFYGIKLLVTKDTLIPRQETEELVKHVIKENNESSLKVLDIGTGTGCIAISLALNMDKAYVSATDNSTEALEIAALNAKRNSVTINFINDDILKPATAKYQKYDLVVCNPPYITESEKTAIAKNVLDYEPHNALFVPDNDALIYYRAALDLCKKVLNSGGCLYFEINENKAREMKDLLVEYGYLNIKVINDINCKARITKSIKP
ncbi:MAG: peptide chain release factor N(5)-glutamine methyltransferase [Bacteroidota bacterium]|nr:peptide chain release factor N(5)-glutamine methyltransferase [Bacteroidota bacterium]